MRWETSACLLMSHYPVGEADKISIFCQEWRDGLEQSRKGLGEHGWGAGLVRADGSQAWMTVRVATDR